MKISCVVLGCCCVWCFSVWFSRLVLLLDWLLLLWCWGRCGCWGWRGSRCCVVSVLVWGSVWDGILVVFWINGDCVGWFSLRLWLCCCVLVVGWIFRCLLLFVVVLGCRLVGIGVGIFVGLFWVVCNCVGWWLSGLLFNLFVLVWCVVVWVIWDVGLVVIGFRLGLCWWIGGMLWVGCRVYCVGLLVVVVSVLLFCLLFCVIGLVFSVCVGIVCLGISGLVVGWCLFLVMLFVIVGVLFWWFDRLMVVGWCWIVCDCWGWCWM